MHGRRRERDQPRRPCAKKPPIWRPCKRPAGDAGSPISRGARPYCGARRRPDPTNRPARWGNAARVTVCRIGLEGLVSKRRDPTGGPVEALGQGEEPEASCDESGGGVVPVT